LKQIKSLLILRCKQGYRYLDEIGFGILAVAIIILTGILFNLLDQILSTSAEYAPLLALILLVSTEIKRRDTFFLKSIFQSKEHLIRYKSIENTLIVLPIIIFQSIYLNWDIILYTILICIIVSAIPFHLFKPQSEERKKSISFIPLSLFEVKFYVEKHYWTISFVLILLLLGGLHISLWILGMFILCVFPVDIFTPRESREMITYSPFFVFKKIKGNAWLFLAFTIIPSIITYIFTQTNILILLYGIIAMLLSLTLSICKKYASYYGVSDIAPSTTATMILIFLMLAPGGILITFSACIYYYFQAEKHMKKIYAIT